MRIAAAQDLDSARRTNDDPAGPSPAVADEPARFQPISGLIHGRVRRLAISDDPLGGTTVSGTLADRLARPRAGSPLPEDVNASFGAQLGTDLSDVRVHADGEADDLARSVASTAFTVGSDIYFTRGSYSTASESGRHLLAHELTHVMQNRQAPSSPGASAPTIGRADDPAERHADRVASNVMQALRRRVSVETSSRETVVERNRTAPIETLRRLQRRQVVRRMTLAAATLSHAEKKPVWVRVKGDRWVPGQIQQLAPGDKAVVKLDDATTVTEPLADIHDAPPPEAVSEVDSKAQLALWSQPAELTGTDRAASASPQVLDLFVRLSELATANNWDRMRSLLFVTHSGKGAPADAVFKGVKSVIDMLRTAPTAPKPGQPLLLTAPPKLDPDRALSAPPFNAIEIAALNKLPQVKTSANLAQLAATGRSAQELAIMARLGVVLDIEDLAAVASSSFKVRRLMTLGGFSQVHARTELLQLAATATSDADLGKLATISEATQYTQLASLVSLVTVRPVDDIVAIGQLSCVDDFDDLSALAASSFTMTRLARLSGFKQVKTRGDLLQLAGTSVADDDLEKLAGITQAINCVELISLVSLASAPKARPVDDIVAIAKLGQLDDSIKNLTASHIAEMAASARTMKALQDLAKIKLVKLGADLALLAESGHEVEQLTAFAGFKQVMHPAELVEIAGWTEKDNDITALAKVGQAVTFSDLRNLKMLLSPKRTVGFVTSLGSLRTVTTADDIVALAGTVRTVSALKQLAAIHLVTNANELVQLAKTPTDVASLKVLVPKANSLADLLLLAGLVTEARTAPDVLTIINVGTGTTFAAPTVAEVVQLCGLQKTTAQIKQLSTAPGIANTAQLVALADRTSTTEKAENEWIAIDQRWEKLKHDWLTRWPLTALFAAVETARKSVQKTQRAAGKPADKLQASAVALAQMMATIDLIEKIAPALEEGATALAAIDSRILELKKPLEIIDTQVLPYYPGTSPARKAIDTQRAAIVKAQQTLESEKNLVLADQKRYAALGTLTPTAVSAALAAQHNHTLAIAAVASAQKPDDPVIFREKKLVFQQLQPGPEPGNFTFREIEADAPPAKTRPMWEFELAQYPPGDLKGIFIRGHATSRAEKKAAAYERPDYRRPIPTGVVVPKAVPVRPERTDKSLSTDSLRDAPTRMLDRIGRLLIDSMLKLSKYRTPHISLTIVGQQVLIAGNTAANKTQVLSATNTLKELQSQAPKTAGDRKIKALIDGDYQHDHRLEARRAAKVPDGAPDPEQVTEVLARLEIIRKAILSGDLVWRPEPVDPPVKKEKKAADVAITPVATGAVEPGPGRPGAVTTTAVIPGPGRPGAGKTTAVKTTAVIPGPGRPAVGKPADVKPGAGKPRTGKPGPKKKAVETELEKSARLAREAAERERQKQERKLRKKEALREKGRAAGEAISDGTIHGEMELLNNVKREMESKKGDPAHLKNWPFGGVKRDCLACHRAFAIFNEDVAKGLGYQVVTAGTHSKLYPGWRAPTWLVGVERWATKMATPKFDKGWEFIGPVLEPPLEGEVDIPVEPEDLPYESDSDREDD